MTTSFTKSKTAKALLGASTIGTMALSDPSFAAAQTFLGDKASISFRQGVTSAQVQITVDAGKITDIKTVSLVGTPGWPASCINPTITTRALTAQSANINGVSCASYSSAAWRQSLASAISKSSAVFVAPKTTAVPIPITPTPNANRGGEEGEHEGYEHEGGEGDDDGYRPARPPRPTREPHARPTFARPTTATTAKAVPTPTKSAATQNDLGLTMGAGIIKKSITCVKGKLTKTVKATNPKCPTGYTLKK